MNNWLVPPRADGPELLELGHGTLDEVRVNLQDMWRINRLSGGLPALTRHLNSRLRPHQTIVDLGTGSGNLLHLLSSREPTLRIVGVDNVARNLRFARHQQSSNITLIQADATQLPFQIGQVDYFVSNFLLHHFAPEQLIELLRRTFAHARRGIIMSDLQRHQLPIWGYRIIAPLLTRNFLTRNDGLASIRRAYTPSELLQVARRAGIPNPTVHRHFPWRMTLVADK
jgi:SAM-dependent methyltransferase